MRNFQEFTHHRRTWQRYDSGYSAKLVRHSAQNKKWKCCRLHPVLKSRVPIAYWSCILPVGAGVVVVVDVEVEVDVEVDVGGPGVVEVVVGGPWEDVVTVVVDVVDDDVVGLGVVVVVDVVGGVDDVEGKAVSFNRQPCSLTPWR